MENSYQYYYENDDNETQTLQITTMTLNTDR